MPMRDRTPSGPGRMAMPERKHSFANDAAQGNLRSFLRPTTTKIHTSAGSAHDREHASGNCFQDPSDESTANSATSDRSPGGYSHGPRSISPATSHGSAISRQASYNNLPEGRSGNLNGGQGIAKKGPPPPPPSRSKKPPPPPPMKRADMMA